VHQKHVLVVATRIAGNLILQPITRAHYRYWGATNADRQRTLPGDERVPNPKITTTLSITIDAPASEIWSWLAQLGQERGGEIVASHLDPDRRFSGQPTERRPRPDRFRVGFPSHSDGLTHVESFRSSISQTAGQE